MIRRFSQLLPWNVFKAKSCPGSIYPPELAQLDSYSMSGIRVLQKLYKISEDVVNRQIPGDVVECGVCNGGSAAALACALHDGKRALWLYDSFEGLPAPAVVDGAFASQYAGSLVGSEDKVREALRIARFPEDRCTIRRGWFEETLCEPLPKEIALLHIDADWYKSVLFALDTLYDLVSEGGVIILDDFGHWEGCREAFYDFVVQRRVKPLLERFGHSQVFWVKGRSHNREFRGKWEIP